VGDDPEFGAHRTFKAYDIGEVTAKNILSKRDSLSTKLFSTINQVREVRGIGEDKVNDLRYSFSQENHKLISGTEGIDLIFTKVEQNDTLTVMFFQERKMKKLFFPFRFIKLRIGRKQFWSETHSACKAEMKSRTIQITKKGKK
jgi:hypothetical protein